MTEYVPHRFADDYKKEVAEALGCRCLSPERLPKHIPQSFACFCFEVDGPLPRTARYSLKEFKNDVDELSPESLFEWGKPGVVPMPKDVFVDILPRSCAKAVQSFQAGTPTDGYMVIRRPRSTHAAVYSRIGYQVTSDRGPPKVQTSHNGKHGIEYRDIAGLFATEFSKATVTYSSHRQGGREITNRPTWFWKPDPSEPLVIFDALTAYLSGPTAESTPPILEQSSTLPGDDVRRTSENTPPDRPSGVTDGPESGNKEKSGQRGDPKLRTHIAIRGTAEASDEHIQAFAKQIDCTFVPGSKRARVKRARFHLRGGVSRSLLLYGPPNLESLGKDVLLDAFPSTMDAFPEATGQSSTPEGTWTKGTLLVRAPPPDPRMSWSSSVYAVSYRPASTPGGLSVKYTQKSKYTPDHSDKVFQYKLSPAITHPRFTTFSNHYGTGNEVDDRHISPDPSGSWNILAGTEGGGKLASTGGQTARSDERESEDPSAISPGSASWTDAQWLRWALTPNEPRRQHNEATTQSGLRGDTLSNPIDLTDV